MVTRVVGPVPVATLAWRGSLRRRAWRGGTVGWTGPRTVAPVFLLTQPRTGSGLLAELVTSLPGFGVSCGEVLHPQAPRGVPGRVFRVRPLNHVAWSLAAAAPGRGVAVLHMGHLRRAGIGIDDLARRWPDARFLATYRRSLGDMFVSGIVAQRTRQWSLLPGEAVRRPDPFVIQPTRLAAFVAERTRAFDEVLTHPVVGRAGAAIAFEDLAADPSEVFGARVLPLLGLPPNPLGTPRRRRQRDYELEDLVANIDEVRDLLAATYEPPPT